MQETDSFVLITTLVSAFGLALVFGYLAERFLKTPALVGYIIAGVVVTLVPGLPQVDVRTTQEFAELGVMLLMFGVGLHFSVSDLMKVKGVAVTGALIQMTCSAIAGGLVATFAWGWSLPQAVVFGLTLSCASTVVVMKALELRHFTSGMHGQVAIGWLVVQDLVTVFIMVCMPIMAQLMEGEAMTTKEIAVKLSSTFLGVAVFVAGMLLVGRRLFPYMLKKVAELGSRELFTLCVLALAIGVAYGASAIFNVSYALGAFFAGMVMRESSYAHRAAVNSLPLQDAFAVLFFVSVGLMLDWHVFIEQPFTVISVMSIIMLITSSLAMCLVVLLGWPLQTALIVGACLAQIGEFSFILCAQGIGLGLADRSTMSLIVAASVLTIALNPLMFVLMPKVKFFLVTHYPAMRRAAMRESPLSRPVQSAEGGAVVPVLNEHVIIVGFNPVVRKLLTNLRAEKLPVVCLVTPGDSMPTPEDLAPYGAALIAGDPLDPMALVKARVTLARLLVLPGDDSLFNRQVLAKARQLNPELKVLVRVNAPEEKASIVASEDTALVCDLDAAIDSMTHQIGTVFQEAHGPVPQGQIKREDEDQGPQAMEVRDPSFIAKQTRRLGGLSADAAKHAGHAVGEGAHNAAGWLKSRFTEWRSHRKVKDNETKGDDVPVASKTDEAAAPADQGAGADEGDKGGRA